MPHLLSITGLSCARRNSSCVKWEKRRVYPFRQLSLSRCLWMNTQSKNHMKTHGRTLFQILSQDGQGAGMLHSMYELPSNPTCVSEERPLVLWAPLVMTST